ncbi:MAG: biotin/lipoyl-binding protein [Lachnospiraceae bacterium]|nr:biotin/lipoyl-binding protein [Lachnospiraceae bacterium]
MSKLVKRILVSILAASLICGGIYGALIAYRNSMSSAVRVYSVSEIASNSYYYDDSSSTSYGNVASDRMQSCFVSSTMNVTELAVSVGDTVKKGDVLFSYDTTLTEIQVEKADLDLQEQKLSLQRAKEDLERLGTLSPSSGGSDGGGEAPDDNGGTQSEEEPTEVYDSETTPKLISDSDADGSMTNPYIYLWGTSDPLTPLTLLQMFAPGQNIILDNTTSGEEPTPTAAEPTPAGPTGGDGGDGSGTETPNDPAENPADDDEKPDDPIENPQPSDDGAGDDADDDYYSDDEYADDDNEQPDPSGSTAEDASDPAETEIVEPVLRNAAAETDVQSVTLTQDGAEGEGTLVFSSQNEEVTPTEAPASGRSLDSLPDELYVILEVHKFNNQEAPLIQSYGLHLFRYEDQVAISLFNTSGSETPSDEEPDSGAEMPEDDPGVGDAGGDFGGDVGGDVGGDDSAATSSTPTLNPSDIDWTASYTAKEIAEMKEEKTKDVRDLTIAVSKAEISLREMKAELTDGSVKAKFDGEVKTVRDPDDAKESNSAVVVLSGGGGYYVKFSLGELELEKVTPGTQVSIESFENGMIYSGTIQTVSDYPSTGNDVYSYGIGNPLSSYYPATVSIDEDAELRDGDFVQVSYSSGSEGVTGLYLDKMFIRSEDGQRYVYVKGEDGTLQKRNVVTGKILMDTYVEIRSGLTTDDSIAFPYGTGVKDGAKTEDRDLADLYS